MGGDLTNEISPIEADLERLLGVKKCALVDREAREDRREATVLESKPAYESTDERLRT
jgi:glycine cleavage system aminomethyltransferase T